MVHGLTTLPADEWKLLESYFQVTLIGGKPFLQETTSELSSAPVKKMVSLPHLLDLMEALWIAQALKERHFDSWFADLKKLQRADVSLCITLPCLRYE